jgi:molybdopterin-guanine dinucleotide biosynthesis protein A
MLEDPPIERPSVVVLAGGEGSRIGGAKPFRLLGGRRLIDRALDLARSYGSPVAVAARDPDALGQIGFEVIRDGEAEGPVGGLIAGLRFAREKAAALLLIPVDAPFLPADLVLRLAGSIGGNRCAVASSGGQLHPVCSLWRVDALGAITAYLATGRRSLHGFADWVGYSTAEWTGGPQDRFFNLNTPSDLNEAERRLTAR